jgi:hypothetical protein
MSRRRKIVTGLAIAAVGLIAGIMVYVRPEGLRAPLWVAITACFAFVVAGTAVVLHGFVANRTYLFFIVVLVTIMTTIAAWLAFGSGATPFI